MDAPLVSVIVPTKNRQFYAEKTVRQIADLKIDIEIIVQDNSDNNSLCHQLIDLIHGGRINYSYNPSPMGISSNYNLAAERATGKYLCAIGDDDGVLPTITECALWMEENEIDAVKPARTVAFYYPKNVSKFHSARLSYEKNTGRYLFSNPEAGVIALLDDGGAGYLEKNVSGSYHGLVSMKAMRKVKEITGEFYGGLVPDMYSVICLSVLPGIRFAVLDYPITIMGVCPSSGAARCNIHRKTVPKLEDSPHLKAVPSYQWSEIVPKYYDGLTVWAETMIYSLRKMNREDLISRYYNEYSLGYYLCTSDKERVDEIITFLKEDVAQYVLKNMRRSKDYSKILNFVFAWTTGKKETHMGIKDVIEAATIVSKGLKKTEHLAPWYKHR